ncbi:MAG: spore maturation protein A [Sphingobacteriia bacterium]|nr:spore maturation protein A [Sphingobacteriia bacterium]
MMNYIWAGMIVLAFFSAMAQGNMQALSDSVMVGGTDAINLCLRLLGIICLWSGLMKIAERSGLTNSLCKLLYPILKLIFPKMDLNSPTAQAISMNMTANLLGLGNAATPFGIEAMKRMNAQNQTKGVATNDMIKLVVLNSASLRIIPTTVAMLRQQHGAQVPMDIMTASWISSAASLFVGMTMVWFMGRRKKL